MAADGVCLDVLRMDTTDDLSKLEDVAKFCLDEASTVYGSQEQMGLARALLRILQSGCASTPEQIAPCGIVVSLERIESLVRERPPIQFGLESLWSETSAELTTMRPKEIR